MRNTKQNQDAIAFEVARMLCREIRADADANWTTASARWCNACRKARQEWATTPAFSEKPGNRGCELVNARYSQALAEGRELAQ